MTKTNTTFLISNVKQENKTWINQDDIIWILKHFKELRVLETKIPKARAQLNNLEDAIETIRNELGFLAGKTWRLECMVDILTDRVEAY
jgi:hypothetical protein